MYQRLLIITLVTGMYLLTPLIAQAMPSYCGGEGMKVCCAPHAKCRSGLIAKTSKRSYRCGKRSKGVKIKKKCVKPSASEVITSCGGLGQRACCIHEGRACKKGLREYAGCQGDCACKGNVIFSSGRCGQAKPKKMKEPKIGWTAAKHKRKGLWGYADLHMHLATHLGHSGKLLHGRSYHPDGVNKALQCGAHGGKRGLIASEIHDLVNPRNSLALKSPKLGPPLFNTWPTWHTTIHQQVYYKWLERAWRGGLRLIVDLAVTNSAFCNALNGEGCENSMTSIDRQLEYTKKLEKYIAKRGGWFKIVKTPAEARRVIKAGKLAVVQGIEVDYLFNCRPNAEHCDKSYVKKQIKKYKKRGVRVIFPVHNFDNAFGSPAAWQDGIEAGQVSVTGEMWETGRCPSGYAQILKGSGSATVAFTEPNKLSMYNRVNRERVRAKESCHGLGLTSLGKYLVKTLMNEGILVDVDHMGIKSYEDTMKIAESRKPKYPILASHVQLFDLYPQKIRHERMSRKKRLKRIARSGGMIGAMLKTDHQDTKRWKKKLSKRYGTVKNNCEHSSRNFAQALQYAIDVMKTPVAMGSDFNGVAGHFGPRFGSEACALIKSEKRQQKKRLKYPFKLKGLGSFDRQKSGDRTFDYNHDGLAHVGLLPDMVADLSTVGLPKKYTDSLFSSAEQFIKVWERAEKSAKGR